MREDEVNRTRSSKLFLEIDGGKVFLGFLNEKIVINI